MAAKLPQLKPIAKLVELARRPATVVGPLNHQSHGIPVPGLSSLRIAFLYCPAMIVEPKAGLQLKAPQLVAFLNSETGAFEELLAVSPSTYGQKPSNDEFIGTFLTAPEQRSPDYLSKKIRLYEAYDAILPLFAAGQTPSTLDDRKAASEFSKVFAQVAEGPLLPYYQVLGKPFFDWLKKFAA